MAVYWPSLAAVDVRWGDVQSTGGRPGLHRRPTPSSPTRTAPALAGAPAHGRFTAHAAQLVDRLDSRHDELIAKLDELNAKIEAALVEFGRSREASQATVAIAKAA